ncbi:hypothetical protein, partial [Aeromonas caviae]
IPALIIQSRSLHQCIAGCFDDNGFIHYSAFFWLEIKPEESAVMDKAIVVKTTRYALMQAAGLDDKGRNYDL